MVNNLPAKIGDIRDVGSISGRGRSPGEGHDNQLQYSCLGNPMDRGAWWATVHWVAKIQTQLRRLSMHACYKKIGSVNLTEHELEIKPPNHTHTHKSNNPLPLSNILSLSLRFA